MQTVPVPLFQKVYRNIDEVELSDQNSILVNGYLDEAGGTRKRPGLLSVFSLNGLGANSPIDGLFWWEHKQKLVMVSAGLVYLFAYTGGTYVNYSLTQTELLNLNSPVTFATDGTYLFMANGGRIVYTDGVSTAQYIADGDAPTSVSHVAYLDGYILANSVGTNKFYWSDVNASLTWTATSFASAAGDADYIKAIHVVNREIYLLGNLSTEIWENDGTTPFSRITSGFIQVGLIASNSVVNLDNHLFWLGNNRYFVTFTGRGDPKRISTPYDKEIQGFETVSDCQGLRIEIEGKPFLIFNFISANKTLCYNVMTEDWSEWNYINPTTSAEERWLGSCHAFSPAYGKHFVGSRNSWDIYQLSGDYYDDNTVEIRLKRVTGHINYGTLNYKKSNRFSIILKRGVGLSSRTPTILIRWNDDNKGFGNYHEISLGDIGDRQLVKKMHRSGVYRTRQYEITASDPVPIVFIGAQEEIEVLTK